MVYRFGDLGIIEKRPYAGSAGLPRELYIETGVQFEGDVPADQGKVMMSAAKVGGRLRKRA